MLAVVDEVAVRLVVLDHAGVLLDALLLEVGDDVGREYVAGDLALHVLGDVVFVVVLDDGVVVAVGRNELQDLLELRRVGELLPDFVDL